MILQLKDFLFLESIHIICIVQVLGREIIGSSNKDLSITVIAIEINIRFIKNLGLLELEESVKNKRLKIVNKNKNLPLLINLQLKDPHKNKFNYN
jgi:hypothetical protein